MQFLGNNPTNYKIPYFAESKEYPQDRFSSCVMVDNFYFWASLELNHISGYDKKFHFHCNQSGVRFSMGFAYFHTMILRIPSVTKQIYSGVFTFKKQGPSHSLVWTDKQIKDFV